jgi:hypothetical protein
MRGSGSLLKNVTIFTSHVSPQQIISKHSTSVGCFALFVHMHSEYFLELLLSWLFIDISVPYIDLSVIHYRESGLLWMIREAFPV